LLDLAQDWTGLPVNYYSIPAKAATGPSVVPCPVLSLAMRGRGKRVYYYNGRQHDLMTAPGMMEFYAHDFQRERASWEGTAGRSIGVRLEPASVAQLLGDDRPLQLATRHEVMDSKLGWLMQEIAEEASKGTGYGARYAEGLSIAILGRLFESHAGLRGRRPTGGLSIAARRRVIDFIEANLGHNISIASMAREAALSPYHFAHCFKVSFGTTPHKYMLQRRMEKAFDMLKAGHAPIADIAVSLGFSSQSHFTQVFKQYTGRTPGQER
jgi:AraC family transcriptional regulator